MDLREYIFIMQKWWWIILLGVVLSAPLGYVPNRSQQVSYRAKTTLLISGATQKSADVNQIFFQLNISQQLAIVYSEMVKQEPIVRPAVESLNLEEDWTMFRGMVSGEPVENTQFFKIFVFDTQQQRAKDLADAIAQQLIIQTAITSSDAQAFYYDFAKNQLTALQKKITDSEQQIQDVQKILDTENTPEGIRRRQEEIASLENKINIWQKNYASLLSFAQADTNQETVQIIEPATVSTITSGSNTTRNMSIAVAVGLSLAIGLIFFLEHIDDTIKTTDDVQRIFNWPILGTIVSHSQVITNPQERIIVSRTPFSPTAEAYRALRTTLESSGLTDSNTNLLITSSVPGEGKTMTAVNLAVAIAQSGKKVILVDADLRHPMLHKVFDLPNKMGLTNLLVSPDIDPKTALKKIDDDSLKVLTDSDLRVLTSGTSPPNPAELLSSPNMDKIVEQLIKSADIVIFDSPPLLAVTDATLIAKRVTNTILVVEAGRNRPRSCQRVQEIMRQVDITPAGVVLNQLTRKHGSSYYYYYQDYYFPQSPNGRQAQPDKKQSVLKRQ